MFPSRYLRKPRGGITNRDIIIKIKNAIYINKKTPGGKL